MATDKIQKVILEAVDCLRQRKCRPDRESIAVYVIRKLGNSMSDVYREIENIVDQGDLLKVEYKGSTSYRSPKNFDLKNSPLLTKHSKILNSSKTTRYVISGINELLSNFPNYAEEGVPYEELKKKLLDFDSERFAEGSVKVIFEREESAGNIQAAESNDPVYATRIFPKDITVPSEMKRISFIDEATNPTENKKRKRTKKIDEEGDAVSTGVTPKKKSRKKPEIVYAVKSNPDKIQMNSSTNNDTVKVKAEQISSIGLKVMARKNKLKPEPQDESVVDTIQEGESIDRTPSLALVKHDNSVESSKTFAEGANGVIENDVCQTTKTEPPKTKVTKKKNSPVKPRRKAEIKVKIDSDDDSDDQLTLSHIPPRYTYSAKRRFKRSYFDETDADENPSFDEINVSVSDSSNGHSGVCAYCRKEMNSAGHPEKFLSCGTCNDKIHPTCIDYSEDHAKRLRMNSKTNDSNQWQCFSCKRCGVCQNALMPSKSSLKNDSNIKEKKSKKKEHRYVLCDQCDRGYHASCINRDPPASINADSWFCGDCEDLFSKNGDVSDKAASSKLKAKIKSNKAATKKKCNQKLNKSSKQEGSKKNGATVQSTEETVDAESNFKNDEQIPDISAWTPNDVQNYFTEKGLREEAASLREQEIDGTSLLLLRRADVIFGLNLRLGPALKIYRLVCQLQQNSSTLKKKSSTIGENSSDKAISIKCSAD